MVTSASDGYSQDWVGEAGLDIEGLGYCITLVRWVGPRKALHRLGVSDAAIRTATWPEFCTQHGELEAAEFYGVTAAFVMGEHTALVEDLGWRGRLPEWTGPVSRGTEAVNVYLHSGSLKQELSIFRDGEQLAFLDGDEPEVIYGGDEALAGRLIHLTHAALKPGHEDDAVPQNFDDGQVDLLHVACGYCGLEPRVSDVSGPVLGVVMRLWP